MKTNEIRSAYLDFFEQRGHRVVPSSSLVPANDPTLLFTNAGMVQFKDALTGREQLDYRRAVSCQRCVRAGGKHNDLENVGYTARHQTLFEMLGNFSFGDYFKEDAIAWAWEFVTGELELARDRIWVTVHPTDSEAREIWIHKIGLAPERVVDHEENFWAMGDTGPCGPDSELFYDLGSGRERVDRRAARMRMATVSRNSGISSFPSSTAPPTGRLSPLATPGVDTGMGLERVVRHRPRGQEQLRDRPAPSPRGTSRTLCGGARRGRNAREPIASGDRRSRSRRHVPDRRRRLAGQRGSRIRIASDNPARPATRLQARHKANRSSTVWWGTSSN